MAKPLEIEENVGVPPLLSYRKIGNRTKIIFWHKNGTTFERSYQTFRLDFYDIVSCNRPRRKQRTKDNARYLCMHANPVSAELSEVQFQPDTTIYTVPKGSAVVCEQVICGMYVDKNGKGYTAINLALYGPFSGWINSVMFPYSFDYFEHKSVITKDFACHMDINCSLSHHSQSFFCIPLLFFIIFYC